MPPPFVIDIPCHQEARVLMKQVSSLGMGNPVDGDDDCSSGRRALPAPSTSLPIPATRRSRAVSRWSSFQVDSPCTPPNRRQLEKERSQRRRQQRSLNKGEESPTCVTAAPAPILLMPSIGGIFEASTTTSSNNKANQRRSAPPTFLQRMPSSRNGLDQRSR